MKSFTPPEMASSANCCVANTEISHVGVGFKSPHGSFAIDAK